MKLRNKNTGEIVDTTEPLADLNKEWEVCEPRETSKEVKKIPEIIRAWAEVNGIKELKYIADENSLQDIFRNSISFNRVLDLKDGETYTVAELCGEEEE